MKTSTRMVVTIFLFLPFMLTGCATPPSRTDVGPVEIVGSTLMALSGKPNLLVGLVNHSDSTVWVRVVVEATELAEGCNQSAKLTPNLKTWVGCPLAKIAPEFDYSINVTIYIDDKLLNSAGTKQTKARFGKQDVEWLQRNL